MADETTYKIDVDTGEAKQKVEALDESAKSLAERLESAGGSGRELGGGIAGGVGQGLDSLGSLGGALGAAEGAMSSLGSAGESMGGQLRSSFENAADASDGMGTSFAKNFNKAQEAGKGFSNSIGIGIAGAVDTAKKKVGSFVKDTVAGGKKIGDAFLHPVKTIQSKFTGSMKDAAKAVDEVGDEAAKTEQDLENMGRSGEGASEKLKTGLGKVVAILGAVAIAAAAVTGIAKFTTAALEASQAAQNISYAFEQTFGASAVDVEGWADNFASAVHRSTSEVKSFLTANRQLYEGMGITGDAADTLSKMTTSLAYDLGNFAGIDDAEALSKIQDAIKGNTGALSDFGVRLDDATLKQTAMTMGLGDNLDNLDEAALAQVRFNSILEQTEKVQGNASKSLGGLTGGVKAVKAAWTDFLAKAGDKLAPVFDKIFGVILDAWPKVEPALMTFVDLLADGFEMAAPIIGEFAENLLPTILDLVGQIAPVLMEVGGAILPVLSQVLGTVSEALQPVMGLFQTLATTLLPPLTSLFGMLVEKLLPPLANLFGALSPVVEALSPVFSVVASVIGTVADAIATLIGWITSAVGKIGEFADAIANSAVGKFVGGIGEGISNIGSGIKNFFTGNAKGTDDFEGGWTRVHEAGGELIHNKNESGLAFLPKGSAVIPASKTDEILSPEHSSDGKVFNITNLLQRNGPTGEDGAGILGTGLAALKDGVRNWIPTLIENSPLRKRDSEPDDQGENDDTSKPKTGGPGDGDGNPTNGQPDPAPAPRSGGRDVPTTRKIIELHITVSSDGPVPPEVLEQFREVAEEVTREVLEEQQDDQLSTLAIQNGYTA